MLNIQQNIPLSKYTTFRIGGPAKFFVEVKNEEELIEALKYAKENGLEFFILGGGSNVLVSDKGFDGLIIKFKVQNSKFKVTVQNSKFYLECWAGDNFPDLVKYTSENRLTGLEWAVGLPATVGGAIRGNAGAFGSCMKDAIESVKVVDTSKLMQNANIKMQNDNAKIIKNSDCKFGYRNSIFKENSNLIILSVTLKLRLGDKEKIQNKVKEIIEKRMLNHPRENSAGSFFKNPIVENKKLAEEFEADCGIICKDGKLPAGWLIVQAGLKGKKIGGAMVSKEHANFIVNTGAATAEDVIILASFIKQQVRDKFGIELEEEVQHLGF